MKKYFGRCVLSLATIAAVSCTDESIPGAGSGGNTSIEAEIAGETSRTAIDPTTYTGNDIGILWTPTDIVGVFGSKTANAPFANDEKNRRTATSTFSGNLADGETPLYAYYPYSAEAGSDPLALSGNLPMEQTFSETTGELGCDYKYGTVATGSAAANVRFKFHHIFALLRVSIDATGTDVAGQHLEKICFSVPGRQLYGEFTFSAADGSYSFKAPDISKDRIEMEWTDRPALESGRAYVGYVNCAPEIKTGDEIKVSLITENYQADFSMKAIATLEADGAYTIPVDLSLKQDGWTLTKRENPEITSLSFTAAANPGKILDREIVWNSSTKKPEAKATDGVVTLEKQSGDVLYAYVPYLHSRSLVPTFNVPEGMTVYHGDSPVESGKTEVDFLADPTLKVVSVQGKERLYTVKLENTGLPVVVINQSSSGDFTEKKVGGFMGIGAVTTNHFIDFWVRGKDTEFVTDDEVTVYNADGSVNLPTSYAGVRLRGNSTQKMDKKPFAIKFTEKQAVLGMPAHKRWCLLANRIDRSLIRNNVAFKVAHLTETANENGIGWSPHGRNVELIIDGRYVGNYYLCEQIKIDSNRVNINKEYDPEKPKSFEECGYLLELDTQYDENSKFETSKRKIPVMFKDDVPADFLNTIKTMFDEVESNLAAGNYTEAYNQLDINSLVDQMLIFEVTMNDEYKHPKSVYYTVNPAGGKTPGDGKIHAAAVWDFDWATFPDIAKRSSMGDSRANETSYTKWNYIKDGKNGDNFRKLTYIWTPLLVKDVTFQNCVKERWNNLFPVLKAEIPAYARSLGQENARSFAVNDKMWPAGTESSVGNHRNGDEGCANYDDVIESIVTAFETRIEWLNTAIVNGQF